MQDKSAVMRRGLLNTSSHWQREVFPSLHYIRDMSWECTVMRRSVWNTSHYEVVSRF
jgi:hypothetical protein